MSDTGTLTDEQLHAVVEAATLAPSVHNTQPWRFSWDGRLLVVAEDPDRGLPVLDPQGRERLISCGAATQHASLALAALGRTSEVTVLPDSERPRLTTVRPGEPADPDALDAALAAAIPRRYTDRGAFRPGQVPADVLTRLRVAAEHHGAWLRPVERPDERIALAVLLSHAEAHEEADSAYREELRRWRTREREQEGIPDAAVDPGPRASEFALRDFDAPDEPRRVAAPDEPPPAEHPTAVVLGTHDDDPEDWVRAGLALGRVLLQATVDDVAASPMTQVIEVARLRARLREELSMVGVPHVVLRLGYGQGRMVTRRRPVSDVLTTAGG